MMGDSAEHPFKLYREIRTWADYVAALRSADDYWRGASGGEWSVLGQDRSWLHTLRLGRKLVEQADWDDLGQEDERVILGRGPSHYALLGNMSGAGRAVHVFLRPTGENLEKRRTILAALRSVRDVAAVDFPAAAGEAITVICTLQEFALGVASRLLTLARPDLAVSLNGASVRFLRELSGLPTLQAATKSRNGIRKYERLLTWLAGQPWQPATPPQEPVGRLIYDMRGGLLDAFVYDRETRLSQMA